MRKFFTIFSIIIYSSINYLQSQILTFNFDGLAGNEVTVNSNSNNSNITSSVISRGSGLTAAANANSFRATNWALTSIANAVAGDDYMEFSITPNSGYQFSVSSINFYVQRSNTGLSAVALRSSVDSYATNLDSEKAITDADNTTQLITFTFTQSNSTTPVTYRLYGYSEATGGTGGLERSTAGDDIIVNGNVALPVEFIEFDSKILKNNTFLNFSTASETNNSHFNIERSADARNFETIGEIKGAGNSNREISYTFTDEKPLPGINYYRIKQTDFDGQYSYSEIRSVRHKGLSNVSVTPRTTEGRLDIITELEDYTITIYNAAGQEVKRMVEMSLDQSISIETLHPGVYFVKINSRSESETVRVVKL